MAFNVCMANNDDHSKNHSFVLDKEGAWQLSPAYDVTHAYNRRSLWTSRHLMSVNGRFDSITRDDLLEVARRFKVSAPEDLLQGVLEVAAQWEDYAHEAGVADESIEAVRQDIDACGELLRR
jgi:serine/threonine-protein kinase HipA